jgi:hypothetical protein
MGCMVPQLLTAGGNRSYPDLWVVPGDPWYPGYKISTVALKPSVERVARDVHSVGDKIGTHKGSMVTTSNPHWYPPCSPIAVFQLKA